jgi:predicted nucleic acid-binding Zn ribbon protein
VGNPENRVGDLIDPALRALGVRGRVREEQLRLLLASVVGPAMAAMCRAERLERGSLLIATANTALSHQLQMEAPQLIAALNTALGVDAVKRLRFTAM